jgi:hypothetical protein
MSDSGQRQIESRRSSLLWTVIRYPLMRLSRNCVVSVELSIDLLSAANSCSSPCNWVVRVLYWEHARKHVFESNIAIATFVSTFYDTATAVVKQALIDGTSASSSGNGNTEKSNANKHRPRRRSTQSHARDGNLMLISIEHRPSTT